MPCWWIKSVRAREKALANRDHVIWTPAILDVLRAHWYKNERPEHIAGCMAQLTGRHLTRGAITAQASLRGWTRAPSYDAYEFTKFRYRARIFSSIEEGSPEDTKMWPLTDDTLSKIKMLVPKNYPPDIRMDISQEAMTILTELGGKAKNLNVLVREATIKTNSNVSSFGSKFSSLNDLDLPADLVPWD